jgi:hypothetical protein
MRDLRAGREEAIRFEGGGVVSEQRAAAGFVAVVDRLRHEVSSAVYETGDPKADYVLASVRMEEAAQVAPCASRFATSELLVDDSRPAVGRFTKGALTLGPSLGRLLRKRLAGASEEARAAVRDVVLDALAFGYLAAVDAEGAHISAGGDPSDLVVRTDRTPEQIWNYWVVSFAGDAAEAFDTKFR